MYRFSRISLLLAAVGFFTALGAVSEVKVVTPILHGHTDAPIVFDSLHVYGAPYRIATLREVAIGTKFKGPNDDTVRFATIMSAAPRWVLLMDDTTTAPPLKRDSLGWRRNGVTPRYLDSAGVGYQGVAVGDVDGDGRTDVVVGRWGTTAPFPLVRLYWNGTTFTRESIPIAPFAAMTNDIAIGDADNDGNNEIFVAAGGAYFRVAYSGSSWTRDSFYGYGATNWGVAIGDFDQSYAGNEVVTCTYEARVIRTRWTGSAWDTASIFVNSQLSLYDVAIGNFDATNPGNELAFWNGYNQATYGNLLVGAGSGVNWTWSAVRATSYSATGSPPNPGEIAVGDVLDTHSGAEIVYTHGATSGGRPVLLYPEGGLWYGFLLPAKYGTSYGIAIGNVNKWRSPTTGSQELIITDSSQVFEYEQRLLNNNDLTVTAIAFPEDPTAVVNNPVKVRMTIRNLGYTTQNSIPVGYQVLGGPTVTETWTGSLSVGQTADYTFATEFTPPADGGYAIKVWTGLTDEQYPADDTLYDSLQVFKAGTVVGQLFNRPTFPPYDWQRVLGPGATVNWTWDTISRYPSGYYPLEGAGMARYACWDQINPYGARLWTHKFTTGSQPKGCSLTFWMLNTNQYNLYYDSLYVEYSTDSLNWLPLAGYRCYDEANPGWNRKQLWLGDFLANQQLWLGFRSRSGYNHDIYIDSVRAYLVAPVGAITDIAIPRAYETTYPLVVNEADTIAAWVKNLGLSPAGSFDVILTAGATPIGSTNLSGLAVGESALVRIGFVSPAAPTRSHFRIYHNLTGDENPGNDTVKFNDWVFPTGTYAAQGFDFITDWPPTGWETLNFGASKCWTQGSDLGYEHAGRYYAECIFDSATVRNDDWLVSPAIVPQAGYVDEVGFFYRAYDNGWRESLEVWVMRGQQITDTIARLFAVGTNSVTWRQQVLDLDSYDNDTIFIGFRNRGLDKNALLLDDIWFARNPALDVGATAIIAPAGSIVQNTVVNPRVRIRNFSNYPAVCNLRLLIGTDYDTTETGIVVPAADSLVHPFAKTWTAAALGNYNITAYTILAGDVNPANDTAYGNCSVVTAPSGWRARASVPAGPKNKNVKDGGCLTYNIETGSKDAKVGFVYALKGNNRCEFYKFNTEDNTWATKESIPIIGRAGKKKAVKKGAAITTSRVHITGPEWNSAIYAAKGNNCLEWWRYDPALSGTQTYPWSQMADIPTGSRTVKEGAGAVTVKIHYPADGSDTNFIYFLKGSGTQEFYRYNTVTDIWETKEPAPLGASSKPWKNGSCITYAPEGNIIYALKGSYNEFFAYHIDSGTWTTLNPLPFINRENKKKKVKEGAGIAYAGGVVYALKGGNTVEFWQYFADSGIWQQSSDDLPLGGGKRVKGGGALTYGEAAFDQTAALYALKGNNTLEFYDYPLTDQLTASSPLYQNTATSSENHAALFALNVRPNPLSGATTISYSLPRAGNISLKLYDITGKLVTTLIAGQHQSGSYSLRVPRAGLSAGVYLLKLETGTATATTKLIVE